MDGARRSSPSPLAGTNWDTLTVNWLIATGGSSQYSDADLYWQEYLSDGGGDFGWAQWDTNGLGTSESATYNVGGANWTNINGPSVYIGPAYFDGLQGQSFGLQGESDWSQVGAESATTRYLLYTGGRSLPGAQTLWSVAGNAQQILNPWYPDAYGQWMQWVGDLFTNVPYQDVSILGQTEDSNGSIWTSLFDGESVDVTPHAFNAAYYTMAPAPTNYVPIISVNGTQMDPDSTLPPDTVYSVGQQLTFTYAWSPSPPPGIQSSNITWSFHGGFVNASNQPPTGSPVYSINTNLLTNETALIWMLSGPGSPRYGNVDLTIQYTLATSPGQLPKPPKGHLDLTSRLFVITIKFYRQSEPLPSIQTPVGDWFAILLLVLAQNWTHPSLEWLA